MRERQTFRTDEGTKTDDASRFYRTGIGCFDMPVLALSQSASTITERSGLRRRETPLGLVFDGGRRRGGQRGASRRRQTGLCMGPRFQEPR